MAKKATITNKKSETQPPDFAKWLNGEMRSREWSQNRLAREAGLSRGEISRVMNGKQPSFNVCKKIAHALDFSLDFVLREAGLQLKPSGYDDKLKRVVATLTLLEQDDLDELLELARIRLRRKKRR